MEKEINREISKEKNKNIVLKKQVINNQNDIYNYINEILPKAVKKEYTPGIIGLTNVGAICYMNATIQCFSNIKRFKENLLIICQNPDKNQKKKKFSLALAEIFQNLWVDIKDKEYAPHDFKKIIEETNLLFKEFSENNPQYLIQFLLEIIHKELNNPPKKKVETNEALNYQNFCEVWEEYIQNFINENSSIISEEFYGCFNSMTMCYGCGTTIHNVQTLNILSFPLEEVRRFIGNNFNLVKIEDCFLYYQKKEIYPCCYCNN